MIDITKTETPEGTLFSMSQDLTHEQLTDVINAHERTELQGIDHAAFFTALDQPEQATSALKTAYQRYQIKELEKNNGT